MNQPTLFQNVRPSDPETSHKAARANPTGRISLRQRVLEAHQRFSTTGLTDYQLAQYLGDVHQGSCAKRRQELMEAGLIEDSGRRRLSPFGAEMIVWRVSGRENGEADGNG